MGRIFNMLLPGLHRIPGYLFKLRRYSANPDDYSEEQRYELIHNIAKYYAKFGKITTDVRGLENLPKENGFVLTPNHQGMYDILGLVAYVQRPVTMILKKELMTKPVLKRIITILKARAIDRNDLRQSMNEVLEAAEEVKAGRNYVIFPEGTRHSKTRLQDGNKVYMFKAGSFKIATKSKAPIIPVAIMNSYRVFESHEKCPVTVKFRYLPAICYEEYKEMTTIEIANLVQSRIQEVINKEEADDAAKFVQ